ncbi:MAG: tyrosine-type recombinase/integrase [Planctomycetia bacterium]|nr:tyrosine-type recombinase/integrase [Planctomycetia bacterium]
MGRPRLTVPTYRKHKQSGQAVVTLTDGLGGRREVLLGPHGTAASRQEYARVLAEWEANGRALVGTPHVSGDLSVNELILAYWRFAEGYYRKNGAPTSQLNRVQISLKPVKQLYGLTPARDFGPLSLKAVRQKMVEAGRVRRYVNACVGCVKRMFKWGVENELVPPSVYHGLQAVAGLKRGRCEAAEGRKVRPVADDQVEAALPLMTPPVRAMVQVQRLSGMRPGEVILMRPGDIDRSNPQLWYYRPESHKTEHHDVERVVVLGPKAQAILLPFLFQPILTDPTALELAANTADPDAGRVLEDRLQDVGTAWRSADAYLFSPREAIADFRTRQRQARRTKVQPSQQDRRKPRPRKAPGERYTVDSYRQAIQNACKRAKIPNWHPHQLRHTQATEIRREAGLDAARAVLGHRSPAITEVYAELDVSKAAEVMGRLG